MSKKDEFNIYRDIFGVKDRDFNGDVDWRDCEIEGEELERIMKSKSISDYNDDVDDYDDFDFIEDVLDDIDDEKNESYYDNDEEVNLEDEKITFGITIANPIRTVPNEGI